MDPVEFWFCMFREIYEYRMLFTVKGIELVLNKLNEFMETGIYIPITILKVRMVL